MEWPRVRTLGLMVSAVAWQACGGEDLTAIHTGEVVVTTASTGEPPDPDGYLLSLDGGPAVGIGTDATVSLTAPTGQHQVALSGLAGNCTVDGSNPVTATVTAGDVVEVAFAITCRAGLGSLMVTTTTTGTAPDPDGYTLTIDAAEQAIGVNATVTVAGLTAGPHQVSLEGTAANCLVLGDNPRSADVVAGGTAAVGFQVVCTGVERWDPVHVETQADLPDVWGSGPADVFVVGEAVSEDGNFELSSVILHYDGGQWAQQLRTVDLVLRGVWGSGPADVFAVGFDFASPDARILRYDGTTWKPMAPPPADDGTQFLLLSVWGTGPREVYAVGSVFDGFFAEALILAYDGIDWRRMPVDGLATPELVDVWGSSASDVYAVGQRDGVVGVVLHLEGVTWSPVLEVEGLNLQSVWGSSAGDVFAAGFQSDPYDESSAVVGAIWHYDGTRWSEMQVPAAGVLFELWGTSASDVFAVGQDGVVMHYDGTAWTARFPTTNTLLGVWGSSPADVFAVGNVGTILHGVSGAAMAGVP
jgi:hypothetical protein